MVVIKEIAEEVLVVSSGPSLLNAPDVMQKKKNEDAGRDQAEDGESPSHSSLVAPKPEYLTEMVGMYNDQVLHNRRRFEMFAYPAVLAAATGTAEAEGAGNVCREEIGKVKEGLSVTRSVVAGVEIKGVGTSINVLDVVVVTETEDTVEVVVREDLWLGN
jgi:hypothetical protein